MLKLIKYVTLGLTLTLTACQGMEYGLHHVPNVIDNVETSTPEGEPAAIDVLLVLDNSGSMHSDWEYVSYGLTQVPEELNDYGFDWQLAITSMDPTDGVFIVPDFSTQDPGWAMVGAIDEFRSLGGGFEHGFSAALRAQSENSEWFREDVPTLIIFVSDEAEQSGIDPFTFHSRWGWDHITASIVGPESEEDEVCADAAPLYHAASQHVIDICTSEPWSIVDLIVR